jgi:2,3,4,5-tetrahydropyridine-2,6-dicarboxylate N-succinyltransferase
MSTDLAAQIDAAWDRRGELTPHSKGADVEAVEAALDLLDSGEARVATRAPDGRWETHQWLKKAVLLSFRITPNQLIGAAQGNAVDPSPGPWWDKVHSKFLGWGEASFQKAGFRAVPGAIIRRGAFVAKNAVLMPSFVNIGAHVGEGAMIDTWATVGSCAQIGKNVHLSGGAGIGGVLEPLQANPTIVEDDCFIGARSEVAEGVIVRQGAVLAMGTFISQSTKIIDRATGAVLRGEVPAYSVIVPGSLPDPKGGPSLACAVIVKRVDAQTRAKTSVNDLLRD